MKRQYEDQFSKVANQVKGPTTNLISDAGYLKFIQDYISCKYGSKVLELYFDGSGAIEAILSTGEIISGLNETIIGFKYRTEAMI
jgi:hypothetical protein